jgi:hypothetical protein
VTNKYIEAPVDYEWEVLDGPVVYVAGGITGADDWQHHYAVPRLLGSPYPVVVVNPRRHEFNVDDDAMHAEQVVWEYRHLNLEQNTVVMVWFPDSRVEHPIAWFEFGMALARTGRGRQLVVGCHPNYVRAKDVRLQWQCYRSGQRLYTTLPETVDAALDQARYLDTNVLR